VFASIPTAVIGLVFIAAAVAVWLAGIRLADSTDQISDRLDIGQAIGGMVILAIATNLPELAISVSAALSGNAEVAVANILGGIAIQTVVLVIIDAAVRRRSGPLTYRANSLVLGIEGLFVVGMLAAVLMATQLPESAAVGRVGFGSAIIAALWLAGLYVVRRAQNGMPWTAPEPDAPDPVPKKLDDGKGRKSLPRSIAVFVVAALVTLAGGWMLERSGNALSEEFGLSGVLFGATFLALATSLPEISTGIAAARAGGDRLAISDIFGGNAFLPVLFLLIALVGGRDPLSGAEPSDLYLTALGMVLTVIFVGGLIFRSQRRLLGVGRDSVLVAFVYVVGLVGLIAIAME